ncbi:MAG TPA: outer membrane beta-barrel protein [Pyrinomonadaceae bacterium]|nr:outer membrane beta-barrel protein [Pyrinomonadaceae bacterium]
MKNFILALCLTLAAGTFAFGQTTTVSDDYKKVEGYVGYSNGQIDTGADSGSSVNDFFRDRRSFHGVNVSGVYNFNRYLGVKGDVSATFNNDTVDIADLGGGTTPVPFSFESKNSLYNFVGGIQIKDNAKSGVFKPFAHAMVGAGHARNKIGNFVCGGTAGCPPLLTDETFSDTGFAGVFGGGIDFRLNNRIQIRAIQVDYNPVRVFGQTDHNLRLGAGIVF